MISPMSRKQRRKLRGHYCWACERYRSNERFSGRGHSRHVCRDCAHLGKDELEYRSAIRNLGRCVTLDGFIRRKQRKQFERFLEHSNPRVRAFARDIEQKDLQAREFQRSMWEADEAAAEAAMEWAEDWTEDEEFTVPEELPPEFGEPAWNAETLDTAEA